MRSKWKEYPHLFANGKFKCKRNETGEVFSIYGCKMNGKWLLLNNENTTDYWQFYEDVILLARPIEGMTDEEAKEVTRLDKFVYDANNILGVREHLIEHNSNMQRDEFLYLLSIGVYPFDQSDFENDDLEAI